MSTIEQRWIKFAAEESFWRRLAALHAPALDMLSGIGPPMAVSRLTPHCPPSMYVPLASFAQIVPLFALEKEGGFKKGNPRGIAFAEARLAAGATALRNMIVDAWLDGASTPVG